MFIISLGIIGGCGGGGGGDTNFSESNTREVTGSVSEGIAKGKFSGSSMESAFASGKFYFLYKLLTPSEALASGQSGTFMVTAIGTDGTMYEADTDADGSFSLHLLVDDFYLMSFTAHMGPGMMDEFWDFMVFPCGEGHMGDFHNQFFLPQGDSAFDLGDITVFSDHRFAVPMHNPLEFGDSDDDGVMDFDDPDFICGNVEDINQDGYYDDDMDHDGFHDEDMDHDGYHDDDQDRDGFHDDDHMMGGGMGPHM